MDIRGQYEELLPDIKQAVCDVIDSGRFILGPNVRSLEEEFAASVGHGHAVSVANGTDALELALQALGIGPGDEVVTTAYTFYATAEAIARTGATPVFADIDPVTLCLDPAAAEAAITERTRAIVLVHIFGQPGDCGAFRELADRHGIALIEDAAQAFGAELRGASRRQLGRRRDVLVLPHQEPPGNGRRRHDRRRLRPRWPTGSGCCASTARATSGRSSTSASTRGWTRCRRRSSAC